MRLPVPKESDVQAAIVDALRLAGLVVDHTSAFRQKGGSGVSKGVADLIVYHPLESGLGILVEVKKPGRVKWTSKEQEAHYKAGRNLLAQSPKDALLHVRSYCEGEDALAASVRAKIDRVLAGLPD